MNWKSDVVKSSIILMILINGGNFLNLIFHFVMGRMLGVSEYASLVFLTTLIGIFAIPGNSIQTMVSKRTTKFLAENRKDKIKGLISHFLNRMTWAGIVIFLAFVIFFKFYSESFKVPYSLIVLTGVLIFFSFWNPIFNGVVQAKKNFNLLGSNFLINMFFKLFIAIVLVYYGLSVYGALAGIIIGSIIGISILLFYIYPIKEKTSYEDVRIRTKQNVNIFIAMSLIVIFYSLDIILVKFLFDSNTAGEYGAISTIAKIVLFGTMSIGNAMFPISSEKFENGKKSKNIFLKSFLLVGIISLIFSLIILFFPEKIVNLLYGAKYVNLANRMIYLTLGFISISLLNIFLMYKISINKLELKHSISLIIFLILEVVLFILFGKTIETFSFLFMIQNIIIFILSLIVLRR